jgi:hypothetical protein
MDNWDQEAVDLVKPGFIEFGADGLGDLGFIVVTGQLDYRDADRDDRPGVEFSWQGADEGDDEVSGRGWAALNADGTLEGHVYLHLGDDSAFHAERFNGAVQRGSRVDRPGTANQLREAEVFVAVGVETACPQVSLVICGELLHAARLGRAPHHGLLDLAGQYPVCVGHEPVAHDGLDARERATGAT